MQVRTHQGHIALVSEAQKRSTWEQQAIKRLGQPADITGAAIVVDGGQYRIG
jgi:hypothetical protein